MPVATTLLEDGRVESDARDNGQTLLSGDEIIKKALRWTRLTNHIRFIRIKF